MVSLKALTALAVFLLFNTASFMPLNLTTTEPITLPHNFTAREHYKNIPPAEGVEEWELLYCNGDPNGAGECTGNCTLWTAKTWYGDLYPRLSAFWTKCIATKPYGQVQFQVCNTVLGDKSWISDCTGSNHFRDIVEDKKGRSVYRVPSTDYINIYMPEEPQSNY